MNIAVYSNLALRYAEKGYDLGLELGFEKLRYSCRYSIKVTSLTTTVTSSDLWRSSEVILTVLWPRVSRIVLSYLLATLKYHGHHTDQ